MGKRKLLCTPERQAIFDEAMERIKKATGARTQVQLAEVLDVRQSSISDAKRRCSIPSDWQLKLWRSHKLNPDWVMTGTGGQFIDGHNHDALEDLARTVRSLTEDVVDLITNVETRLDLITMTEEQLRQRKAQSVERLGEDMTQAQAIMSKLKNVSAAVAGLRQ